MGNIEGFLLGVLQGLTEFLPVSSSGHLVIFQDFFGVRQPGITFEVMVHFGTLLSVIWVFGADLLRVLTRAVKGRQERHFALMLLLGIIPTGLMGYLFSDVFKRFYESTVTTGFMLLITGGIIYTLCCLEPGKKGESTMGARDALFISVAQGLAIIPGISRSGSTITAAIWRGLDRETAVKFSFLVSVPVIFGATLLELKDMSAAGFVGLTPAVFWGTVAAFLAGVIAINFFIHLLKTGRFHYFAYYCWFAGSVTIILKVAGF
ncbi:undecaprenyl-diphosphate phosphatase [Dethiobacter alkaliphilus]|uniref:undecaprenyl-diphosphate phosphatase n=1 Tax=Dethiobacter alkaliphilus TaxID=427926 RepID=UPI0022263495|nr:undecaprenyl-diphosphate phosphatase [Dethiobacter alkaliphilus]MCW3490812.1 undecaprenyl-diphosphate phosphatase [Dethiobacter alkaliphilus]